MSKRNQKTQDNQIEIRTFAVKDLRASQAGDDPKISGYAAIFNSLSEDLGGFRETIKPGAFIKTIQESDVRALFNHDKNFVLGRKKAGTLRLAEDEVGLSIEIDPPDTQAARDLITLINRGDVDQMSFSFRTVRDDWDQMDDQVIRTLIEVKLFDISPVTFPAYPQTSVQVREKLRELQQDPPAAPIQEDHPADGAEESDQDPQVGIDLRKKRLDLAEFQITLTTKKRG